MYEDLTFIIPVYNEENSIGKVVDEIRSMGDCRILAVDNNSKDGTLEVLKQRGVDFAQEKSQGKGCAVRNGINYCKSRYLLIIDGDYTYSSEYLSPMYRALCSRAQIVVGRRIPVEEGAMSTFHGLGNLLLSTFASRMLHTKVHDLCSGMWGFHTEVAKELCLQSVGFNLETEMWLKSVKGSYKIEQVPVAYRKRIDGDHSKLRISDGFRFAAYLWRNR